VNTQSDADSPVDSAAPEKQAPLLEVTDLVKNFSGVQAVRGCTFSVQPHQATGLIGPNGAGKSTVIEVISGFQAPDAGSVRFDGHAIQGRPAHKISNAGLVRTFQTPREWANLTTLENVLLATGNRENEVAWRAVFARRSLKVAEAEDRARARELLDRVGLLRLKNELAGNLSGGQKRLLEFAKVAFAKPKMVLLDEPHAGVNPVMGGVLAEAINGLVADGMTVLMVEHNLAFLERVCDSVVVMALGQVIATGTMSELRENSAVIDAYLGEVLPVE
jgi:ABC-type branched-subunit amino acid transport system ATPase component